jgi:FMN phosphatase YigB (HAD superfamily)
MFKGIFFDLDGTLLPLDLAEMMNSYFRALTIKLSPLVEPVSFMGALMAGVERMLYNDGHGTNEQVFLEAFSRRLDGDYRQLLPVFDEFYINEYRELGRHVTPRPEARRALDLAAASGAKVVLATNPVFPRLAVEARLEWAGLAGYPFAALTSYENSCFCKPNPSYYLEILEATGLQGHECLMVGNDTKEDLVAAELGFSTFLLEDFLIDRGSAYQPNWRGSWEELLKVLGG